MAVKMSDIAEELNVSVVTVSKVLRNQGRISEKTKLRVLQRCRELNYQPNLIARSLATRRTFTIGLLLPDFTHPFFAQIAKSVAQTARARGYHALISYFDEDCEIEVSEAQAMIARRVDGLILASAQTNGHSDFFKDIRERQVPLVLIDRLVPKVKASYVGVDHVGIGKMATEHLIAQGCRNIVHLRGPQVGIANDRLNGYCLALDCHGFPILQDYIVEAGFQKQSGYAAMHGLLESGVKVDGVFCYNDPVAVGAIEAVQHAGRKVPQDIAVVGAGNINYADMLSVPLSSIDQGPDEIGRAAGKLLLDRIESRKNLRNKTVIVPHKLVARASTDRHRTGRLKHGPNGRQHSEAHHRLL
jgi:LacI family transcriptional regulator